MISGGVWNTYYRPAWRSTAAQLRNRGVDIYITGIIPQDASSYFRDITGSWPPFLTKAYEASTQGAMDFYQPEMIRNIVFGGKQEFDFFLLRHVADTIKNDNPVSCELGKTLRYQHSLAVTLKSIAIIRNGQLL